MTTYKLYKAYQSEEIGGVIKDNVTLIPINPENSEYQEYLEWLSEGNEPEPADTPEEAD